MILPTEGLEPVQVGLNLITARAGSAILSEPFSSFALPDYQEVDGIVRGYFEWMPAPYVPVLPQLSVAGRMGLWVRDQHGNPLSNFVTRFTFRPPPVQLPPPSGMSLTRPATTTPGRVLSPADYRVCLTVHLQPHYGECVGEESSVLVGSTHLGVFSYAVLGDSPWSAYTFDVATTLEPVGWIAFHTSAYVCTFPEVSQCEGSAAPYAPYVVTGVRPVRVNRLGNFIEAYPVDGEGPFLMWADAVSEKERVTREIDPSGNEHFIPIGTNEWRRERLLDSEVRLTPETTGTWGAPGGGDSPRRRHLRVADPHGPRAAVQPGQVRRQALAPPTRLSRRCLASGARSRARESRHAGGGTHPDPRRSVPDLRPARALGIVRP